MAQLAFVSQWNAFLYNIPLLRFSPRGEFAVVYPKGRSQLSVGVAKGATDVSLEIASRSPTVYQKWGLAAFGLLWTFLLVLGWAYQRFTLALRRPYARSQILF